MKKKIGLLLCLMISVLSCVTTKDEITETAPEARVNYPALVYNNPMEGALIYSPINGELIGVEEDQDGEVRAVILNRYKYYYKGQLKEIECEIIFGGLESVTAQNGFLEASSEVGRMGKSPYLTSRARELEPYMVRTSFAKPIFHDGYWWFSTDWIKPTTTQFLSFRAVDDFELAVDDFYNRWFVEGEEPKGATLHYFPELDRIRVPFNLNELPVPITDRTQALYLTETQFYNKAGLFTLENKIIRDGKYNAVLYWQKGFDKYLIDEYTLGSDIWLYCSIYALDHDKKEIIISSKIYKFLYCYDNI